MIAPSVKTQFAICLFLTDSPLFLDLREGGPRGLDVTTVPFNYELQHKCKASSSCATHRQTALALALRLNT